MSQPEDKKHDHSMRLMIVLAGIVGFLLLWNTGLGSTIARALGL
jgi:hypothetical protein